MFSLRLWASSYGVIFFQITWREIWTTQLCNPRQHKRPPLQWRHNERDGFSNHQPHDCLLKRLFRRWSKETSKIRVTGLCVGSSPVTDEFPAQRASNAKKCFHLMTSPCWWPIDLLWHSYIQDDFVRVSLICIGYSVGIWKELPPSK